MKGELRKRQILEAAKTIFSSKGGYHEAHVEDVIREAQIGKGTFYQYFKNKEQLFISLLELFLDEWESHVSASLSKIEQEDVVAQIRLITLGTVEFFYHNQSLCKIYLSGGIGFGPVFEPYVLQFEERMLQYVSNILRSGISAGEIKDTLDLELVSNIFLGAILRVIYYHFVLKERPKKPEEVKRISEGFFEVAMQGIRSS